MCRSLPIVITRTYGNWHQQRVIISAAAGLLGPCRKDLVDLWRGKKGTGLHVLEDKLDNYSQASKENNWLH